MNLFNWELLSVLRQSLGEPRYFEKLSGQAVHFGWGHFGRQKDLIFLDKSFELLTSCAVFSTFDDASCKLKSHGNLSIHQGISKHKEILRGIFLRQDKIPNEIFLSGLPKYISIVTQTESEVYGGSKEVS